MNTQVNLAGVTLKNPVMVASGTFGSGAEYSEFVDLNRLGAGQCDTACGGSAQRYAQCHRTAKSGH